MTTSSQLQDSFMLRFLQKLKRELVEEDDKDQENVSNNVQKNKIVRYMVPKWTEEEREKRKTQFLKRVKSRRDLSFEKEKSLVRRACAPRAPPEVSREEFLEQMSTDRYKELFPFLHESQWEKEFLHWTKKTIVLKLPEVLLADKESLSKLWEQNRIVYFYHCLKNQLDRGSLSDLEKMLDQIQQIRNLQHPDFEEKIAGVSFVSFLRNTSFGLDLSLDVCKKYKSEFITENRQRFFGVVRNRLGPYYESGWKMVAYFLDFWNTSSLDSEFRVCLETDFAIFQRKKRMAFLAQDVERRKAMSIVSVLFLQNNHIFPISPPLQISGVFATKFRAGGSFYRFEGTDQILPKFYKFGAVDQRHLDRKGEAQVVRESLWIRKSVSSYLPFLFCTLPNSIVLHILSFFRPHFSRTREGCFDSDDEDDGDDDEDDGEDQEENESDFSELLSSEDD